MSKLIRQMIVLSRIPPKPKCTSLNTIFVHLNSRGIGCSRRTLERDIVELELALQGLIMVETGHGDLDRSMRISLNGSIKPAFLQAIESNHD